MLKPAIAFLLGTSLAATAVAQQPAPPADDGSSGEIVVQGARNLDKQVSAFVNALADAPVKGQLGRFEFTVCPGAVGLDELQNVAVARRMRRIAEAIGLRVGPIGCTPNALLMVTGNKRELIETLYKRRPGYFQGVGRDNVNALARSEARAAAWQVEGRVDADGVEVPRDKIGGQYIVERTDAPSRLSNASRPHFIASVVVVEADALAGLSITQVADYAAMRSFARTDPARLKGSPVSSILKVLDAPMGSAVPITMTEWDFAFLKALYGSNANRFAFQQRNEMKHLLQEELVRPSPQQHQ